MFDLLEWTWYIDLVHRNTPILGHTGIKIYIQSFGQNESVFNYDDFISKIKLETDLVKRLKDHLT